VTGAAAAAAVRLRLRGLRSAIAGPFDLSVAASECIAITGPSGSGKSLFLRMIADLDPNEGEVWLDGQARSTLDAPAWRSRVVYNAAEPGWWSEQVAAHFPGSLAAPARRMLPSLGLSPDVLQSQVARLSTGERQRLALIRAFALAPPVLLLDEPTGALDPRAISLVEAMLRERLVAGTAILLVTHDTEQASRLGARRYRMAKGTLLDG
jgi:putative ABC transport system ATP-binding protein